MHHVLATTKANFEPDVTVGEDGGQIERVSPKTAGRSSAWRSGFSSQLTAPGERAARSSSR